MQVKTVSLTGSTAQVKQNITEENKKGTDWGKHIYSQHYDMSMYVLVIKVQFKTCGSQAANRRTL